MSRHRLLLGLAAVLICGLAASPAHAVTVTVTVGGANGAPFYFFPRVVAINPGDTVQWVYAGGTMAHNVVSDDGLFNSGTANANPFTFSYTFVGAGTFFYHCVPHEFLGMTGIVFVGANRIVSSLNQTAYTLGAWDFEGLTVSTQTGTGTEPFTRTITSGTELRAGVHLPSGVRITGLELAGCDASGGSLTATLNECLDPPGTVPIGVCTQLASVSLTDGVCEFKSSASADRVADNVGYSYHVAVTMPGTGMMLRSVRVFYERLAGGTVYVPITPCRIVDTRTPPAQLVAGVDRAFNVVGSGDFSSQGGSLSGCGIPGYSGSTPRVRAVMFNFVAVSPAGPGNLRAWATDQLMPNASVLNYAAIGMNIANGIAVGISQDGTQGNDLSVRASASNTHLIVDVVGYFTDPLP